MIIQGGTSYFTIDFVRGFHTLLPDAFVGGLNDQGNGCIVIRYGGWRFPVIVHGRILRRGWRRVIKRMELISGTTLFVAYCGRSTISLLKFWRSMGVRTVWHLSAAPFDFQTELIEEEHIPEGVLTETVRTSYVPRSTSLFFARESGVREFKHTSFLRMRVPLNLAQHLRLSSRTSVNIRSGDRVFENVDIVMGYFRGFRWSNMVEVCDFDVGFKIFFFLNQAEEFEMIVVGPDNLEAVYDWSRSYYRIV